MKMRERERKKMVKKKKFNWNSCTFLNNFCGKHTVFGNTNKNKNKNNIFAYNVYITTRYEIYCKKSKAKVCLPQKYLKKTKKKLKIKQPQQQQQQWMKPTPKECGKEEIIQIISSSGWKERLKIF